MNVLHKSFFLGSIAAMLLVVGCHKTAPNPSTVITPPSTPLDPSRLGAPLLGIQVPRDIQMKGYFEFMDSLVARYDSVVDYALTEHILVANNPWIIDTLASYDFDDRIVKCDTILDQKEVVMLHKGDTLWLPNDSTAAMLQAEFAATLIDVNIPEYKLRIIQHGVVKYTFPVRVGRDELKFLSVAGRVANLRTPIGEGKMERIERNPVYMNPVDGKKYEATHRDNGMLTKLPRIPFMEPSINGMRPGALMHPTTNPHTLGKAYSNGCVGMTEAASWIVYYHAPIGTAVRYRYETKILDAQGDTLELPNIYQVKLKNDNITALQESAKPSYVAQTH